LEGVYRFTSGKVSETLELCGDGSFSQVVVVNGRTNTSAGQWSRSGPRRVILRNFLVRYDTYRERTITPEIYSRYEGYWDTAKMRIFFDVDNEGKYFLAREIGATPQHSTHR
jgi:hypothetical protein